MNKVDVAVIGGGPGGLATAAGIRRARPDARVVVLERRPEMQRMGAGLVLMPNGLKALEAVCPDALPKLQNASAGRNTTASRSVNLFTGVDKLTEQASGPDDSWKEKEERYGYLPVSAAWYKLQRTLADEVAPGVLQLGKKVTSVAHCEDGDGVVIDVDGEASIRSKLVVGADGYFSRIRSRFLQDGEPTYAGSWLWRALVPKSGDFTSITVMSAEYVFILFALDDSTACWVVSKRMAEPRVSHSDSFTSVQAEMNDKEKGSKAIAEVLGIVKDTAPQEVLDLISGTDPTTVTTHCTYIRDPFTENELWKPASGPITLVGDAAHPMRPVGQGTSMAMEDAAELACCITEFGLTEEALRKYEERRIPRCTLVAQSAQKAAVESYNNHEDTGKFELSPIPHYLRVKNFSKDMSFDDWLFDISFPSLSSL